jgi:hypothetical protein
MLVPWASRLAEANGLPMEILQNVAMDQNVATDEKARRVLLKPLARRSLRVDDQETLEKALSRLDDRALGAAALSELREVLFRPRSGKDKRPLRRPILIRLKTVLLNCFHCLANWSQFFIILSLQPTIFM